MDEATRVIGTDYEQRLSQVVDDVTRLGPEGFAAEALRNRQLTSPRGGVLKADAALRYAEALVETKVKTFADLHQLTAQPERLDRLEQRLRVVPGNGTADVLLGYFWMLTGSVKPDRMVLGWLSRVLGHRPSVREAREMIAAAAAQLVCTPWELDHAMWNVQRSSRSPSSIGSPLAP